MPPAPLPDLPLTPGAEGTVVRIASRADVRLEGPRVEAAPGDWVVSNAGYIAVVSAEGKVIDFGPEGGRDEINAITPSIHMGLGARDTDVPRIEAVGDGGRAVRVTRAVFGKQVVLVTWVYFNGPILRIESAAASTGNDPALAVTLGERVWWGNVPTWAEGHGYVQYGGTHLSDFIGRESFGTAYALCADSGRLMARFSSFELPGFYESARNGEEVVLVPPGGVSARRTLSLAHSTVSLGEAVLALPCVRRGGTARASIPLVQASGARAEVARCGDAGPGGPPGRIFAHYNAERRGDAGPDTREIELPAGCVQVRLTAPGHTPGQWIAREAVTTPPPPQMLPQAGRIRFQVTERGRPVPARLVVRGVGVPDPHWGDDADAGAALNIVHAEVGRGERPVPPGTYKVIITRGFEYTAHEQDITVSAKQTVDVKAALERVVDTKGWIAADLHLHAAPSMDAPSPLADRVRSLAAAGIEVGVATDHNVVSDYRPTIKSLGLAATVASIIGDEVTTKDLPWGHFNVFPLAAGSSPLEWRGTLPKTLFAAARAAEPYKKDTIIQVNHPRMDDIGYFELLRLDNTDVEGWLKRSPVADMGFDAIEIFNGDHYANIPKVEQCLKDWYALLNAGFRTTATGNSDSHKVSFHEAGTPRNLVAVPADDPGKLDERAFINAVRGGRVVVSSGPFIRLEVGGKGVGSTVAEGQAEIVLRVEAPPWVSVDRVEIIKRGAPLFSAAAQSGQQPLEWRVKETLKKGDWIIAIARGEKPMPFLHRSGAKPFAFTNPIWVK
jgi:hypothetical protein